LRVDDFEPVLCAHRFGPSYILDEDDRAGLEESIEWFSGEGVELEVLGFYRSQTGSESAVDEQDREWMTRYAAGERSLLLLLRPEKNQSIAGRLFTWRGGELAEVYASEFPFERSLEMVLDGGEAPVERILAGAGLVSPATTDEIGPEQPGVGEPEVVPVDPEPFVPAALQDQAEAPLEVAPVASADEAEPPLEVVPVDPEPVMPPSTEPAPAATAAAMAPLPPGRRRIRDAEESDVPVATPIPPLPPARPPVREAEVKGPRSMLLWAAALLVLTVAGGVLGYRSGLHPSVPPPPAAPRASIPASPSNPPAGGFADRATTPAPPQAQPASVEEGVRASLEQWIRAVRTGDPRTIAASYAPGHGVPAREERPAILRISDLRITPVSEDRAVATFRKHWQTSRRPMYAGEEEDRLTFDRVGDAWKIASEERTRVFWRQQAR